MSTNKIFEWEYIKFACIYHFFMETPSIPKSYHKEEKSEDSTQSRSFKATFQGPTWPQFIY